MIKNINNIKNNYHLNSKYWQDYKKRLPFLPQPLFDVPIGMILGDVSMYKVSREAYMKFEQGYKQKLFIDHFFTIFGKYVFMEKPGKRFNFSVLHKKKVKSFWFKTFSHPSFTQLYILFYKESMRNSKLCRKKTISENLITNYLTCKGLAYWIMCDGSLQKNKKTIILHTQGYTLKENHNLSAELNMKFKLNTKVKSHKSKYYVIEIPAKNSVCVLNLIKPYIIDSMKYKLPCDNFNKM